jgi:CRISPR-associated endoribonuclease Cas6
MERANLSQSPPQLYALLLHLRPLRQGTLMPFAGELVHGAFLSWLRDAAPDVAAWLHEGQKRRLFTCSSLRFDNSLAGLLKVQRENIHLPLDPEKTYTIRLTLLLGDLFPLFYAALTQYKATSSGEVSTPFCQLGKQLFLLEEVTLTNDDPRGWTGFISLASLVERARRARMEGQARLTLEFGSLTAFNRGNRKVGYGSHPLLLPLPQAVFSGLARRWGDIAPAELLGVVQQERLEQYLQEDGMIIVDYDLRPHTVHFTTHKQRGFVGTCTYEVRDHPEQTSEESTLTLSQQIFLLAQLAFYSGVGYKTAMGMGQTRVIRREIVS